MFECGVRVGVAETRPRGGAAGAGVWAPQLVQRGQQDTAEVFAAVKGEKQKREICI